MYIIISPIAFSLGALTVRWYGIIIGIGALLGLLIAIREGKRFRVNSDFFMDLVLIGLPSALVGARIYFVAFQWDDYKNNPLEIIKIWHGGIAIYGALIGALLAGWFYSRRKGYGFLRIVDICAPGLIVGQMIGRWGNFINQEAHGGTVSKEFLQGKLHLPEWIVNQMHIGNAYFHPTFLYESVWSFTGLIFLLILRRIPYVRAGEVFMGYLIWYSIGRFFIEGVRTDSLVFHGPNWLAITLKTIWSPMSSFGWGAMEAGGNIRISQLLSIVIILASVSFIAIRRMSKSVVIKYTDPIQPINTNSKVLKGEH